jgi:hypothetical protein
VSLQVAVLMEIADAAGQSSYVRVYRSETVLPARISDDDDGGAMELADVVLDRLAAEVLKATKEQRGQFARLLDQAGP